MSDTAGASGAADADDVQVSKQEGVVPAVVGGDCAGEAVSLYDAVIYTDRTGLWRGPLRGGGEAPTLLAAWSAGESPRGLAVAPAASASDPEIAVALQTPDGCALRAWRRGGEPAWTEAIDTADCRAPSVAADDRVLVWPVVTRDGHGEVLAVSLNDGDTVAQLSLDGAPTTSAITLPPGDTVSGGGGSHWLVGTHLGVVAVTLSAGADTLSLAGGYDALDGVATSALLLDNGVVALSLRVGPEAATWGARLQLLTAQPLADGVAISALGSAITAPGELQSRPIGTGGCAVAGGGGSHWWCPGSALIAAGTGWVRAWSVPDGVERYAETLFSGGFAVTGMAAGADGALIGAGHYVADDDDRWRVARFGPIDATTTLADGKERSVCPGSPVLDTDGVAAVTVERSNGDTLLVDVAALSPGYAPGWPRPGGGGGNGGQGVRDGQLCAGGVQSFTTALLPDVDLRDAMATDDGFVVVGQRLTDAASWVGRLSHAGWLVHGDTLVPEGWGGTASPGLVDLGSQEIAVAHDRFHPSEGEVSEVLGWSIAEREVVWSHTLGSAKTVAIEPAAAGRVVVVQRVQDGDHFTLIEPGAGVVDEVLVGAGPTAVDVAADGDVGWVTAGTVSDSVFVRAVGSDLTERWSRTAERAGFSLQVRAVTVSSDGVARVLVGARDDFNNTEQAWLYRWSREGVADPVVVDLETGVTSAFGTQPDGASLLVDVDFRVRRLADDGSPGARWTPLLAANVTGLWVAPLPGGDYLVGGRRVAADAPETALLARTNAHGHPSCGIAGLCVWQTPDACDDGDPCTTDACVPATGACEHQPWTSMGCP